MPDTDKTLSKFLSLILRHKPQTIGLFLDENGWASVEELILEANAHQVPIDMEKLQTIVATNEKKRFLLSEDGKRIRASQGHSIAVDLQLKEATPPETLFHGTALANLKAIKALGLLKGQRHHVHLSTDPLTAKSVGARYGKPIVTRVQAKKMHVAGFTFFLSQNSVWLTHHVPPLYLEFE